MFATNEVKLFVEDCEIKMFTSTPHYTQVNGQANEVILRILGRMMEGNLRDCHWLLSKTLYVYKI